MLKKILRAAAAGAAFVVVYLVCLYAVQDYLIFFRTGFMPVRAAPAHRRLKNGRW